ncbi:MAG: transcription-repair coupling factor, partial [Deltaproteobacteria bacterium]|nr:transcription-repair coupling factor [Deltaproteobacteria bacterium]
MSLQLISEKISTTKRFQNLKTSVKSNNVSLWGLTGSASALVTAALMGNSEKPVLLACSNETVAEQIFNEIKEFSDSPDCAVYFPSLEVTPYEKFSPDRSNISARMQVLHRILENRVSVVVASIASICQRIITLEEFISRVVTLRVKQEIDPMDLALKLIDLGYNRSDIVDDYDKFALRGGIFDLFPSGWENPVRIEFFGDEIESIRPFDMATQKSLSPADNSDLKGFEEIVLIPASEIFLTRESVKKAKKRISDFARTKKLISSMDKLNLFFEKMDEAEYFQGIEAFVPFFYDDFNTLIDYFESDLQVVIIEPDSVFDKHNSFFKQLERLYTGNVFDNSFLPDPKEYFLDPPALENRLKTLGYITLSALRPAHKISENFILLEMPFKSLVDFGDRIDLFLSNIKEMKESGAAVFITVSGPGRLKRMQELFENQGIETIISNRPVFDHPGIYIFEADLARGFEITFADIVLISERDIFKTVKKKKTKKAPKTFMTTFSEINLGDYVVHVDHGIGIYKGIVLREVSGEEKDFISIKYGGEDRLYVPLEQAAKVQKFVGDEGYSPRIDMLSSARWANTKKSVKKRLREMAGELIELYASRMCKPGYVFGPDNLWQNELEDRFPFEETEDQLKAIEDVKTDMESSKPMDRLICGDVGYGKTEVAIRAAFKAVQNGKQAAVLVPTTILAQQHFNTFKERYAGFDIRVELVSRLRSAGEVKDILNDLKNGKVDIIIGTHKILGKTLVYKDLGLLIVDEEQRFGVTHKEKIKELKTNVDCITLTATPIPRTLQLSLAGVRDMSIINTPPVDRLAIKTRVVPYDEKIVIRAVRRELERNGQSYFVYNKVENIDNFASYIRSLVPEARITVGHGQMDRKNLEKIMIDFLSYKYDILICSTIIESGLDVPKANTIFVYDSHKFGLTQLYQLRGRVGRDRTQAFSYFFYRPDQVLTETAQKRLHTIEEFTELGSGFKIALKDLEIRGAGALLGTAQSGFMRTIGFELYCQLMERTIKEIKGEIPPEIEDEDLLLNLGLEAHLPGHYISDTREKMTLYKRLSVTADYDELEAL